MTTVTAHFDGKVMAPHRSVDHRFGIESPRPAPRALPLQHGSAYLLTWILLGGTPPRPAAPATAPPPLETSFTQSVPSAL